MLGRAAFRAGQVQGFLTDAGVAAADTVAGLKLLFPDPSTPQFAGQHGDGLQPYRFRRAIDELATLNVLTDALIAPLTTVAQLIDLTVDATYLPPDQSIGDGQFLE
jgi:hypothetical protein